MPLVPLWRMAAGVTRSESFTFDGTFSLVNRRRSMHRMAVAVENRYLRQWAFYQASQLPLFESPVSIEFMFVKGSGRMPDADSVAGAAKPIIDGLVDAGLLVDDGPAWVRQVVYHAPAKLADTPRSIRVLVKEQDTP